MRKVALSIAASLLALSLFGGAELKFKIEPDHADHLYRIGERAVFAVTVVPASTNVVVTGGVVRAKLDNFGPKSVGEPLAFDLAKTNAFWVAGQLEEPGFLRLTLDAPGAETTRWSVGYEPEKIRKGSPSPEDFDAFWAAARARLAAEVPLDPQVLPVPEKSTDAFSYYRVSFATFGRRVHGYMSVPKKGTGPYPVDFGVAAAGFGSWTNEMQGRDDAIRVYFSVYPFAPDWNWRTNGLRTAYEELDRKAKDRSGSVRYCQSGIGISREDYFFYPVILGIDRAIDWVAARPDVDRSRFIYQGTSQGGGLGIALVGLNRTFTRAAFFVPALTDLLGDTVGRQAGWPFLLKTYGGQPELLDSVRTNAAYFDAANFASRITCPVRFAVGFSDSTCSPSAVYATFNEVRVADKEIRHGFGMTHSCFGKFYDELGAWCLK